jgi:hypothetical protein
MTHLTSSGYVRYFTSYFPFLPIPFSIEVAFFLGGFTDEIPTGSAILVLVLLVVSS